MPTLKGVRVYTNDGPGIIVGKHSEGVTIDLDAGGTTTRGNDRTEEYRQLKRQRRSIRFGPNDYVLESTNSDKNKLLESKLRKMIREELLREEVQDQDLDYLYKILVSAGPKISKAITNLDEKYRQNQRWQRIRKGWEELSFGYGDFYHKVKAGKLPE